MLDFASVTTGVSTPGRPGGEWEMRASCNHVAILLHSCGSTPQSVGATSHETPPSASHGLGRNMSLQVHVIIVACVILILLNMRRMRQFSSFLPDDGAGASGIGGCPRAASRIGGSPNAASGMSGDPFSPPRQAGKPRQNRRVQCFIEYC